MSFCTNCGQQLADGAKFCSKCGTAVEQNGSSESNNSSSTESKTVSDAEICEPINETVQQSDVLKSMLDENSSSEKRNKFSTYSVITTIAIIVFSLFFLVAFLSGKTIACIIAILQIAITVISWLMKKQIIKTHNPRLHLIALVLATVLLVPYVSLFSVDYEDV